MRKLVVFFLAINWGLNISAQSAEESLYWVYLTDKGDLSAYAPENLLSERSLARREKQGIAVDFRDYPVNPAYRQAIQTQGAEELRPSKWLNAMAVSMDASTLQKVRDLPFVRSVRAIRPVFVDYDFQANSKSVYYHPGLTTDQLNMIGLDSLHRLGFMGHGVVIAVMDNGFENVDQRDELAHLFTDDRILATYDFVNDETDVFNDGWHGAAVLSILAGYKETYNDSSFGFYGSAPAATYILCHTENDNAEVHSEEYNWVAAMEFADSIGADIFSTSLGYRTFDAGEGDYDYADMDGNTTVITVASDIAASRGILVVNSAGNAGPNKITAPADGDSVLAVGAVKVDRSIASFSSQGPAADGDLKPNISAMGQDDAYISSDGLFGIGSGTSFSCPITSGFAACLLQSKPETASMDLFRIIEQSGDRIQNPDTFYGNGIPSAARAWRLMHGSEMPTYVPDSKFTDETCLLVYPNPAGDQINLLIDNEGQSMSIEIRLMDMAGRRLATWTREAGPFMNVIRLYRSTDFPGLPTGQYVLEVRNPEANTRLYSGHLRILR